MMGGHYLLPQRQRFASETFGILENWSLRRDDGRLQEVVAAGGSTVLVSINRGVSCYR